MATVRSRIFKPSRHDVAIADDASSSRWMPLTGSIIVGFIVLFLLMDAVMKVLQFDASVNGTVDLGYPKRFVVWIGLTLLVCTILYAIPRTAFLGVILVTAYLGGAVATNVRAENTNFYFPIIFGVLAWVGLYLRDRRLRTFLNMEKGIRA